SGGHMENPGPDVGQRLTHLDASTTRYDDPRPHWRALLFVLVTLSAAAMLFSPNGQADYLDQTCLLQCKVDCGAVCGGMGSGKAACIKQCNAENKACNTTCL